jgi:LuxR family maltose regulon positive regulatory protein
MSAPILTTKLFIPPPRGNVVLRPHLIGRLNEGLRRKLTLLSAPAGFGKTTLLSEWIAGCQRPAAWLSLDEGDNDAVRFWSHFIAALQTLALPHKGEWQSGAEGIAKNIGAGTLSALQSLQSPQSPSIEVALTSLLNEIASIPDDFILILEDYHAVDSRQIDHALTFLIERLPPHMHLVIATREDPDLPLARLRARDELTELRVKDLRFTESEAAEFLNQTMGLRLSPEDVMALEIRTEGWIAGLQLAALSMQGLEDTAGFIHSFTGSHHFVLDYLIEEVLQKQPERIQNFLLQTSILERMCGPLCDAVLLGSSNTGEETLVYLERANLFIIPLDNERRWYRYHHLFAELLRNRLIRAYPDQIAELHRRASDWYARNASPYEAITHALAIQDWSRAAEIIEQFSDEWPMRAGVATTLGWLESFPAQIRLDRPVLGLAYAWNLFMDNQFDRAEEFLGQLTQLVTSEPHHLGEVFAIRVMIAAHRHDMPAVIALAHDALSLVPREAASPRSRILLGLGYAHSEISGNLGAAKRAFREAYELGQAVSPPSPVGNAPLPLTAIAYLAEIEWLEGNLREAFRMYEQACELAARWGSQSSIAINVVELGRAYLQYEWDDLEGAAHALQESIRIGEAWRNARLLVPSLGLSATVAQTLGQIEEARAAIHRAGQLAHEALNSPLIQTSLAVHQLALSMAEKDWQVVARWQEYYDAESPSLPGRVRGALAIALAQAWIVVHHHRYEDAALRRARSLLEPALAQSQRDGLQLYVTRLLILESLVLHEQGEADAALGSLKHALELAAPENYLRSFLDLGGPAEALLRRGLESQSLSETAAGYVRQLLSRFRPATPVKPSLARAELPIEPLTQREMEVLQLIADGLSNREIGERLFLALSTVKGHTRIIFDKLQVQRRTEAVARGRELGLLSP